MRHLPLTLLASALVIYGCSKTPEPEVQEEEVYLDTSPVSQPSTAAVAPVTTTTTTTNQTARTRAVIAPEQPLYEQEEPLIQEEEIIFIEDEGSGEVQRTYNERQISDDADDFPLYESESGRNYNDSQLSR